MSEDCKELSPEKQAAIAAWNAIEEAPNGQEATWNILVGPAPGEEWDRAKNEVVNALNHPGLFPAEIVVDAYSIRARTKTEARKILAKDLGLQEVPQHWVASLDDPGDEEFLREFEKKHGVI
jgi:hypothetical protein